MDYPIDMQLPIILKKLLKNKDVSLSQLSRATKIPVQTLSNWLNGQHPRSLSQLKTVADFFCVDLDYLCFGIELKNKTILEEHRDEINAGIFEVILRKIK